MTTMNDEGRAVLVRIAALTPAQTDVYKSTLNDDLAEDVFKELLDVTRLPPAHCQFQPCSTPTLEALARRWVVEQPGDPLPWLLRQATHSVQNDDHRRQLRIIMQTGKARGSVDSDVSQRDRDAGVSAGNRKRCLIPALAGGIVLALDRGPRPEYSPPDPPDPEEVEELFALFTADRRTKAVDLLERELRESGQAVPRWREWVGPVWAWWWHPAGQPAAKFRFLHDDAAIKRAAWMTTEFEANRIAITKSPPIISDHSHFDLGALPIAHHYVKETERSTMQRWERWKPRNSPFLLNANRLSGRVSWRCMPLSKHTKDG